MISRKTELIFLVFAFCSMLLWEIYVNFFASQAAIRFITQYQIDKLIHALGGAFIVVVVNMFFGQTRFYTLLSVIIAVSIFWEAFELLLDPQVAYFFSKSKVLWFEDSVGDLVAAVVGAWVFIILFQKNRGDFINYK